jgi:prepilin-type N-terminal cleavage/methylation domain-containing protein
MEGERKPMRNRAGFTLLEITMAMTVLTIILGMLYGAAWAMMKTARTQDSLVMLNSEARQAMSSIVRNLRQADATTILTNNGGGFAAMGPNAQTNIQFRRVEDLDGNGNALNAAMNVELTPPFWITRDVNDANGDGLTLTQLVRIDQAGQVVEVLSNHISPPMATGDMYSAPNGGAIFQDIGGGAIQVTLILRHRADPNLPMMVVRMDEVVSPRN